VKDGRALSLFNALLFATAWFAWTYLFVGVLALALVPLFLGGFVLWWLTSYRTPVDPLAIIVPYLLTVMAFVAHVYEEYKAYLLGLPDIMQGAPFAISLELLVTFAAFLAPILWILGAVLMLRRLPLGYFIASTFLFGMMFIEPTHFLAPFWQSGRFHYVGGMWTAVLPSALGWFTFLRIRSVIGGKSGEGTAARL
jgi:hypothetical protein